MLSLDRPEGIIIHHSATRDTDSLSYQAIKSFHLGKGWDDIGYHFLIETVGGKPKLLTGRGIQYHGAHCKDQNKNDHIGICLVGNYDKECDYEDGKFSLLIRLLHSLLVLYPHLSIDDIHYHRDFSSKTCPGKKFPRKDALKFVLRRDVF